MEKLTQQLYKLMDSFLIETSAPRSLENLNKDRHLFVEGVTEAVKERDAYILGEKEDNSKSPYHTISAIKERNTLREEQCQRSEVIVDKCGYIQ